MGWGTLKWHHLPRIWCYQKSVCMSMYELSAKAGQRTCLRPPLEADKFEQTVTNIANTDLLGPA